MRLRFCASYLCWRYLYLCKLRKSTNPFGKPEYFNWSMPMQTRCGRSFVCSALRRAQVGVSAFSQ